MRWRLYGESFIPQGTPSLLSLLYYFLIIFIFIYDKDRRRAIHNIIAKCIRRFLKRKWKYVLLMTTHKVSLIHQNKIKTHTCILYSPQNGTPSGTQAPWSHTLRDGPSNSKPRSHEYCATAPLSSVSSVKVTVLCAGAPGKLHFCAARKKEEEKGKFNYFIVYHSHTSRLLYTEMIIKK